MYLMYMSDEAVRKANGPRCGNHRFVGAGPFGMPSGEPPCGVASRFLGITQVRVSRLAWRFARRHHSDVISVNRP